MCPVQALLKSLHLHVAQQQLSPRVKHKLFFGERTQVIAIVRDDAAHVKHWLVARQ